MTATLATLRLAQNDCLAALTRFEDTGSQEDCDALRVRAAYLQHLRVDLWQAGTADAVADVLSSAIVASVIHAVTPMAAAGPILGRVAADVETMRQALAAAIEANPETTH